MHTRHNLACGRIDDVNCRACRVFDISAVDEMAGRWLGLHLCSHFEKASPAPVTGAGLAD